MTGVPFVSGDHVALHTVDGEEDREFVREQVNRPEVRRTAGLRFPHGMEEVSDRVGTTDDRVTLLAWADETPVGMVHVRDLDPYAGTGTLGLWIATEHRNAGYGTESLALAIEYAFGDLALRRLEGYVLTTNDPARAIVESLGFTHEGTQRRRAIFEGGFRDLELYGLLAEEYEGVTR